MTEPVRLVLAEDNFLFREGTRRLLEDSGEVQVVAAVGDADELLQAVDRLEPDAVITDIRMPPGHHMEGIAAAHAIRERHPNIGVVVLSQHADEGYAFELLRGGTSGLGYLLKERVGDLDDLFRAIREVMAGRSVIDPKVVDGLVARQTRLSTSAVHKLTPRERDVLAEMAQGKTNAAIGDSLHLSLSAVEKHVNAIFTTLGLTEEVQVNKRVAAVLLFLRDSGLASA
jgi:DNA-binding NarL/FixJ family response regulator